MQLLLESLTGHTREIQQAEPALTVVWHGIEFYANCVAVLADHQKLTL